MMNAFKNYLLVLAMLLSGINAEARSEMAARAMSLQDCIEFALRNSDTLKNARLNISKQMAVNNQVRALALPRVNLGGQLNYFPNPQQTLVPAGIFDGGQTEGYIPVQFTPSWGSQVSLSGSQTLFDGTVMVALKARNTILDVVRQSAKLTEEDLRYQIQRAYFSNVIARAQYRNILRSLDVARDAAHDVEVLYQNGFAEKIDVDRSRVQLNNLETDSIRVSGLLETGEQALKFVIGMNITEPILLTDTSLQENLRNASLLLNDELDYNKRTEYNLLNTALKLNEANLRRYQLAGYPTLNLLGSSGYNYASNDFSDLTRFRKNYLFSTFVGLQLNVPVFNGLLRANQVREARIEIDKTQNNIHQLKLALDFQASQSQVSLKNALLAAESQKRNMELANSVLDLAMRKYKAGVGSNLEVNQAQGDLLISQNNYYTTLLEVINAQADAQKALGAFKD